MTSEQGTCSIVYSDGERCDRRVRAGGLCTGHLERRRKLGDTLAGGKLRVRRKRGAPCAIGRQEPWLDQPECPSEHYSLGFCAKHYQRYATHGDPLTTLNDRDHGPACTFPGCDEPYDAVGLCKLHYGRAWLHDGDPFAGTRINSLAERLLRRVVAGPTPVRFYDHETDSYMGTPPCPCRDWTGTTLYEYGVLSVGGRTQRVHRVAYEIANGPVPDGLDLDHLCCRTLCCEPRHLEPVTTVENTRRRWIVINEILALFEDEYDALLAARRQALVWPDGNAPPT